MTRLKAETFLHMLRRSGLVDKELLARSLSELQERDGSEAVSDTGTISRHLLEQRILTKWQCDKLLEGRHKGFFLGKYKLLEHVGSGGMSAVYLAEHINMARRVAIKVLPKNRVEDSSYLARFYREARAAAALDHPNVVHAYDVDNEGAIHYLVMEYVEGRDLQQIVHRRGCLPFTEAAEYIRQAAHGLAHAHDVGLIHRDIKPANLLVDARGNVKLLDMGLSRFSADLKDSLTIAHDENVLGTADYLAPEQALNSHTVDLRADIYSLGCTLYFLLTGHPPFADGTLPQRLMRHQTEEPPSILLDRPDAPPDLVEICERMMAKSVAKRVQTALEAAAALADWLAHQVGTPPQGMAGLGGGSPKPIIPIVGLTDSLKELADGTSTAKGDEPRTGLQAGDAQQNGQRHSGDPSTVVRARVGEGPQGPNRNLNAEGQLAPPVVSTRASALVDTAANLGGQTIKGPGAARDGEGSGRSTGSASGGSASGVGGRAKARKLPVAKPLNPLDEFTINLDEGRAVRDSQGGSRKAIHDSGLVRQRKPLPSWVALALITLGMIGALTLISIFISWG